MEEMESPKQISLGASDPLVCPMLNLSIYLETAFTSSQDRSGKLYSDFLTYELVQFLVVLARNDDMCSKLKNCCPLGIPSFQKGPATHVCQSGVSRGFFKQMGRWKQGKAIVDSYIVTTLPYPGTFTAAKLCEPLGASKCALKICPDLINRVSSSFIVQQWFLVLGEGAVLRIGQALLW